MTATSAHATMSAASARDLAAELKLQDVVSGRRKDAAARSPGER